MLRVLLPATLPACFATPSAATLPAPFPTAVRCAATGIGFNVPVSAFGGTTPPVTAALVTVTGNDLMSVYHLMPGGCRRTPTVRFLPECAQVPLKCSQPMVGSREERCELLLACKELYALARERECRQVRPERG